MKRTMVAGACALALTAVAGCSDMNSWYGDSGSRSGPPSTSGSSGVAPGSDTAGSGGTTSGGVSRRGAGVPVEPESRNGAFYPGTLPGEGPWHSGGNAPGSD